MIRRTLGCAVVVAVLCGSTAAASPILALDPLDGAIGGAAGSMVGWGFSLTNDTDFLVVSGASFTSPTSIGTFTDFISAFNFFVVGPAPDSPTVSQPFNVALFTGIGSFAIDPLTLPGTKANGQIVLTYDLFSVSPNDPAFDPDTDTLSNGNVLRVDASVSVPGATVPEPGTLLLVTSGAGALSWIRKRRGPSDVEWRVWRIGQRSIQPALGDGPFALDRRE